MNETAFKAVEAIETKFIAFDQCGFGDRYGRFTALPSGDTLTCQAWMAQADWNKAQLKWFEQFPTTVVVHRCLSGAYRESGDTMGTVGEIIERLKNRV